MEKNFLGNSPKNYPFNPMSLLPPHLPNFENFQLALLLNLDYD
jgi:hypothetical protein